MTRSSFSTAKAIKPTMKKEAVLDSELVLQHYQLQISIHHKTGTLFLLFQGMIGVLLLLLISIVHNLMGRRNMIRHKQVLTNY